LSADKRRALGRGLSALIPGAPAMGAPVAAPAAAAAGATTTAARRDYFVCAIEDVHPSGQNPRQGFDEAEMATLVESIREHGVLEPLIVRARKLHAGDAGDGGFTLIAGERRWRAAQKAGLKEVPVVVKEVDDLRAFELALVENLQRADLNPIEEAEAFRRLCDDHGYTHDRLALRVGRDRTTIANALRLLKLPTPTRAMVAGGQLQAGHARALLGLEDAAAIERAAAEVVKGGLSVRQVEALVKRARQEKAPPAPPSLAPTGSANTRDLEARLERTLGVKVRLQERGPGAGKLEIDYATLDELDRVLERLFAR
jgi:ParB family chromosome partitioning protein